MDLTQAESEHFLWLLPDVLAEPELFYEVVMFRTDIQPKHGPGFIFMFKSHPDKFSVLSHQDEQSCSRAVFLVQTCSPPLGFAVSYILVASDILHGIFFPVECCGLVILWPPTSSAFKNPPVFFPDFRDQI